MAMRNPFAYGKVTTNAGVPVAVTNNFADQADVLEAAQSFISIKALDANAGSVYIGHSDMNKSTLAGVFAVIGPSESVGFGHPNTSKVYPRDIYIDVAENGDGVLVYGY